MGVIMNIVNSTRMIQTVKNIKSKTFTLYNPRINKELEINYSGAKILWDIFKCKVTSFQLEKNKDYIEMLCKEGFIDIKLYKPQNNVHLCKVFTGTTPLSALTIEITNKCNLKCIHCYGKYPQTENNQFITLVQIYKLLPHLNRLHTNKIALTGGEICTHPQIIDIALFFLDNGFELTLLTNGYNYSIIQKVLDATRNYHYTIKVSLDGIEQVHDCIRGKNNVYKNVLKSLELISKYSNVELIISTVIMKQNFDEIDQLCSLIHRKYPQALHTLDFVFPEGNAVNSCDLSWKEIDECLNSHSEMYNSINVDVSKRFRCSGGITQCTLSYNGNLKICNAATNPIFNFKYNVLQEGLTKAWFFCGKNIKKFRKEKNHTTKDCKKCKYVSQCTGVDCRVLAFLYKNDIDCSNPLTCLCTFKKLNV